MTERSIEDLIGETEALMRRIVDEAEEDAAGTFDRADLSLYDVIRYHLGWVDQHFTPVQGNSGKRVRPMVCLLSTGAASGDPEHAVPVSAGIELLHNFTLMHDDIQDRSELRRGRPTVWKIWGEAQAINAGDATFALSQLAVLRSVDAGLEGDAVSRVCVEFNRMTLQIVEGQVLDLGFENRSDVTADDYLRMIAGKTAAIVAFAAWAGARIAGRDDQISARFHEFGRLLGLGFQVRDDFLGIWGDESSTGKQAGDDIRGKKQSIPIVMLMESMSERHREQLRELYRREVMTESEVLEVTRMLDEYGVAARVQALTESYHDQALELLDEIAEPSREQEVLVSLAESLVDRSV